MVNSSCNFWTLMMPRFGSVKCSLCPSIHGCHIVQGCKTCQVLHVQLLSFSSSGLAVESVAGQQLSHFWPMVSCGDADASIRTLPHRVHQSKSLSTWTFTYRSVGSKFKSNSLDQVASVIVCQPCLDYPDWPIMTLTSALRSSSLTGNGGFHRSHQ